MKLNHCRRILAVGPPGCKVLDLVKDLTGSAPEPHDNGSIAGLIHEWNAKTAYYVANIPMWIDEITDLEAWKAEFLKAEAKEVVEAVGAWLYCFRVPKDGQPNGEVEAVMKAIQEISERHAGYGAETVLLTVAIPDKAGADSGVEEAKEDWDDVCVQYGFEFIDYNANGKNEFGEKMGLDRLKEALEANEWSAPLTADEGEDDLGFLNADDDDDDLHTFARDEAEMTAELFGVKASLAGGGSESDIDELLPPRSQEHQVEDLDRLMGRLLAVKEQSAGLPEAERKKMAARAVRELLNAGKEG